MTDKGVRIFGDDTLIYLGYNDATDTIPQIGRKYAEVYARLAKIVLGTSNTPDISKTKGFEDFDFYGTNPSEGFVVLKHDGQVIKLSANMEPEAGRSHNLKQISNISKWSALAKVSFEGESTSFVVAGYQGSAEKAAVYYCLLNEHLQLYGGTGLEILARRVSNLAPPVVSIKSKKFTRTPASGPKQEFSLAFANLASGEVHILGFRDQLFLVQKITSNESTNVCAVSFCDIGDEIYLAGQFYLNVVKIQFV